MSDLRHQSGDLISDNKLWFFLSSWKRGNKQTHEWKATLCLWQHVISKTILLKLVFQMLTSVKWMKGAVKGPVATLLAATTASVLRAGDWGLMARRVKVRWTTAWCWCAKRDHSSGASKTAGRWTYFMFQLRLMFSNKPNTSHTHHHIVPDCDNMCLYFNTRPRPGPAKT